MALVFVCLKKTCFFFFNVFFCLAKRFFLFERFCFFVFVLFCFVSLVVFLGIFEKYGISWMVRRYLGVNLVRILLNRDVTGFQNVVF